MSGRTWIFDLETKRLIHEVGGWSHVDKLGLAAAVLVDSASDDALHFQEDEVGQLIEHLQNADCVVGFNILRFDYTVLRPYGLRPGSDLIDRSVDLLDRIFRTLGFRLSLDNLAQATLGESKSADGLKAVAWYREGKIDQVLDYCEQDVRVTQRLWEYGRKYGQLRYRDRNFRMRSVPVLW